MVTNDGQRCDGVKRMIRTAGTVVAWSIALAVPLGTGIPAVAAEVTHDGKDGVPAEAAMVPGCGIGAVIDRERPGVSAQVQWACSTASAYAYRETAGPLAQFLKYQYSGAVSRVHVPT
jgi:hypothetical protein